MKHTLLLATILLSGGVLVSSCSTDELSETEGAVKRIEASICDFQVEQDYGETRTSFTLGSNGYEAVWATGDILGIYPLGGDQVAFPISDGVGTATAVFDGGAWALRGTYKYAAYYPFSTENYTISEKAIPVTYLGQKQGSNNSTAHLSKYDYMAAAATQPSSSGSVTLPFKHLGAYLLMPLTLPKAGTYTQLILTSNSGKFITEGTVDLSAAAPAIKATKYSESITMDLNNITLTSDNLVLTLNMLIAPVDLTGSTIEIAVKDDQGNIYKNTTAWTRSKAFAANTTSKVPRTLESEGTGGSIEGGGGLEEDDSSATNDNENSVTYDQYVGWVHDENAITNDMFKTNSIAGTWTSSNTPSQSIDTDIWYFMICTTQSLKCVKNYFVTFLPENIKLGTKTLNGTIYDVYKIGPMMGTNSIMEIEIN